MFKKIFMRSLTGATAVGATLALTVAATPALTSAPEIRNVACTVPYQGSVATSTDLRVRPAVGIYGTPARAVAKVTSNDGTPTGRVKFTLGARHWTVKVSGGTAVVRLPRGLRAQNTYKVRALYLPLCSRFQRSTDVAYYTVKKAPTHTLAKAPNVTRGTKARVHVTVGSRFFTPHGKVRITVLKRGHVVATAVRKLRRGHAFARFGKYRVGRYSAMAVYLGNRNFRRSSDSDVFRVTR